MNTTGSAHGDPHEGRTCESERAPVPVTTPAPERVKEGGRMRRAVIVTNIPTPYRLPLFNELARQLERNGVALEVVFAATGYRRRKWNIDMGEVAFSYSVLSSNVFEMGESAEKTLFTYSGLTRALRRLRPDVVVVAGFSLATIKLWLRSWVDPTPYIIWSGSLKARAPTRWRHLERVVLVKRAAAFIAYGKMAKEYMVLLGAPPEKVYVGINTVDTSFFRNETAKWRARGEDGGGRKRLLNVGYLTLRKRLGRLMEAIKVLAERRRDFVLDIVGDGDDRQRLEAYVAEHGLAEYVTFHGYRQRDELPRFMAQSHCFVFPSDYDIWGLVLVEAMAAGLPIIASKEAGATPDLVVEGETGFAVDFTDIPTVVRRIEWALDHPREAQTMGEKAQAWITAHASLEKSAGGITEAIMSVLEQERSVRAS